MDSPRRDWSDAEVKRTYCRVCGSYEVELAHLIGRKHDKSKRDRLGVPTKTLWVNPDSVVALCPPHHRAYDAHQLDLLGMLTPEEEAQAVLDAGSLELARQRLCPSAYGALTHNAA